MTPVPRDLLRLGVTTSEWRYVELRSRGHAKEKPWWAEVVTITEQVVVGWQAGWMAEREAIRTELPRYNKANNPRARKSA